MILDEKYEVLEKKGSGACGCVYQVMDLRLGRMAAVKEMPAENEMSLTELAVLKSLRHPALPVITDFFTKNDQVYLVMEYIEGTTLGEYLQCHGTVGQKQAVEWATQLGEVLCYLHERPEPVIHRDVKPSNIMLDQEGKIKLIDFGAAILKYDQAAAALAAGTLGYAAPEQLSSDGGGADEKSDIYGLGATLHFILTGNDPSRPPFILAPIREYNRTLSGTLEKIVARAVCRDKEKRYESVRQMLSELSGYRQRDQIKNFILKTGRYAYRLLLAVAGGFFYYFYRRAETQRGGNVSQMIITAVLIGLLCVIKEIAIKIKSKKTMIRIRNVCLTQKKTIGLILLFLILAGTTAGMKTMEVKAESQTSEGRNISHVLPVTVRDENGYKILIRFDTVYELQQGFSVEIPEKSFQPGRLYRLKIECSDMETEESRERSFYLRAQKLRP